MTGNSNEPVRKRVTILGSTGSVGLSTLDVIGRNSGQYQVFALTANTNATLLAEQCRQYRPRFAVLCDEAAARQLRALLAGSELATEILVGPAGLNQVAAHADTDYVMAAIVGAAGLASALAAVEAGKRLLLANKEALVMSGSLFMQAVRTRQSTLLPIDSEHNAIFQSMANGAATHATGIRKILLTGSGGPLRQLPLAQMSQVTPDQACAHPNWSMGRKISVDSATMMNKGLEIIEAKWLFDLDVNQIEVVVHPQSIIHSMVDYIDGSIVAQLGNPDMRTPIAHGLAWPNRIDSGVSMLDMTAIGRLDFEPPDLQRFPCLRLAQEVARGAQSLAIAMNAANEVVVQAFLDELILFTDIPLIIESVLEQTDTDDALTMASILAIDNHARQRAVKAMQRKGVSVKSSRAGDVNA
ncbi:MAG: 1-deoxy-D-xylulose-5-phosphate reductoisomerase [SAR86 cluster bacterium]|jgi:1-deoxy-D-xylulose-5-phosphate reductoisomerase|uniref:1-deoxy-D-xylulose 5-phosphate reductoisomerase n=1 Tax=SAR86 cluster bacterium TaxID=2030880 RepID=A0A973AAE6_9GAMM|nr:1-deoxy-D-xylulose-5-phosphate reductoisomerase [SAR86 cluster bacterium]